MYEWMKKIHMYAGLLTFTAFIVWGITGIHAVFLPAPGGWRPPDVSSQREFSFSAPGHFDDKATAKLIYEAADIAMAGGHYNVHRDEQQNLAFFVFTANGRRDITYLEEQQRVRVEIRRNSLAGFLSTMHTSHSRRGPGYVPSRLWGFYNEFSTWAFLFMSLSGIYMWLATRPRLRWAQLSIAGATVVFVVLWMVTR